MGVSATKFQQATPLTSGVTSSHLPDIHYACRVMNTFLIVRPSTVPTMRLIDAGFATKSMDIHDKSSDWGLTSGLVPIDQAFSKALKGQPNEHLHPHAHGEAQAIHLNLLSSFEKLKGQNHFEHMKEITIPGACTAVAGADYRHFHCDSKNALVCFVMKRNTGEVFWHWRHKKPAPLVKVWVWGYKGTPVTGDYDMWMVAPHITKLGGKTAINSNKDSHGRSAASSFTTDFIRQLNVSCCRTEKPVFNHGAEAQNVSFTQATDRHLVVFCPGLMPPFMLSRVLLPGLLHDFLLHGYAVVRNPKWINGVTLGIEDMADAVNQFPDDPAVKAGVGEFNKLKTAAATQIQRRWRDNKGKLPANLAPNTTWNERYNQLRYFRAIGRMPNATTSPETLILPDTAFPVSGAGSGTESAKEVVAFGKEMEAKFTRTGFVSEDGHVSPVDQTIGASGGKDVRSRINEWEKRKG